jgi:hypothetical protein
LSTFEDADEQRECLLIGVDRKSSAEGQNVAFDPTETLPIDYCALRGPDLYAILYEDALDDAALERLLVETTSGKRFEAKSAGKFWRILLTAS